MTIPEYDSGVVDPTQHPAAENLMANFGFNAVQLEALEEICDLAINHYLKAEMPLEAQTAQGYRQMFAKRRAELAAQLKP